MNDSSKIVSNYNHLVLLVFALVFLLVANDDFFVNDVFARESGAFVVVGEATVDEVSAQIGAGFAVASASAFVSIGVSTEVIAIDGIPDIS
jgi:hypothetical protein